MSPALHAALSAVFFVHAAAFAYLALRRRKGARPVIVAAGFAFLALSQLAQATGDPTPPWQPGVAWAGRGLLVIALGLLVAARLRRRAP